MIKILELFGGIGAPRKAMINLGIDHKSIDYVEWNEKAVRTYNAMFDNGYKPESVVGYNLRPDILIHGSPCQDFSVAGKQYGGNVGDGTRSSLMFETIKIIRQMGEWKPRVVIWENVKNALSTKMRPAYLSYIRDMHNLGYKSSSKVLNSISFGVPQYRERLFVVSVLGDEYFSFKKLEHKKMKDIKKYLEEDVWDEKYLIKQPSMLNKLPTVKGISKTYGGGLKEITTHAWTITTKQMRCPNSGIIKRPDGKWRYLTERECWRLMGFSDEDFEKALKEHPGREGCMNSTLYHQAGNSIVVDVLEAIFKQVLKQYELIKEEQ